MTLIASISGIRGTIGGKPGEGLTPEDIVKFTAAYGTFISNKNGSNKLKIVVGRDARLSGPMVNSLVISTLQALGMDVVDIGLSTTPTVEIAVPLENANGGIIITASHNPVEWNALKLLNEKGEFLSEEEGKEILEIARMGNISYADVKQLGKVWEDDSFIDKHIDAVLGLPYVDVQKIKAADFKVVVDGVNSSGGVFVPRLLNALGVQNIKVLFGEPHGDFPHNPEPLPEHLTEITAEIKSGRYDLGIVVDPDVDRLAFVTETGEMFGEEYTLVAIADYLLGKKKGNTVSNLSSTRALKDVTEKHGAIYFASAVGEVNVVEAMKKNNAVIGGEGNGGIILPDLHYGRDALVGIALFLSHLAEKAITVSALKKEYPSYFMAKKKIELTPGINPEKILTHLKEQYKEHPQITIDGLRIDFDKEWVHLRRSNTEPIMRVYTESPTQTGANLLADKFVNEIKGLVL